MWTKETIPVEEANELRARWFRLKFDFKPDMPAGEAATSPQPCSRAAVAEFFNPESNGFLRRCAD